MTLLEMYDAHTGLPTEKYPHHLEVYERCFSAFRGKNISVLEIGIRDGGSLQLWKEYFGKQSKIYGIDIQDRRHLKDKTGAEIFVGNQADPDFLAGVVLKTGPLKIIIDDGSHASKDQIESFQRLFPRLENGGLYIVEDIHTSYRAQYNEGESISFVEYLKYMIDSLHRNEQPEKIFLVELEEAFGIHIFPSLVIIEKRSPGTWGGPTMRGTHV